MARIVTIGPPGFEPPRSGLKEEKTTFSLFSILSKIMEWRGGSVFSGCKAIFGIATIFFILPIGKKVNIH